MSKAIVNSETNLSEKKPRKSPVPSDPSRITAGALKLHLQERVDLVKKLQGSIAAEVAGLKALAENAVKISNGMA